MKEFPIVKYLLSTVDNGYTEKLKFNNIDENSLNITIFVNNECKIRPVLMMIEANMYTRKELRACKVAYGNDMLTIDTFNNITYNIGIKTCKKHK